MSFAENTGPLKGIRVVEMGQLIAGPFCGQLLGDMGAEIIKVEPPGQGDPMRVWGRGDYPLWWEVVARNKKAVSADLRQPQATTSEASQANMVTCRPEMLIKWATPVARKRSQSLRSMAA